MVSSSRSRRLHPARRHAARLRAGQRGTALTVVVLAVTLLMGIGLFAARSARLATVASGSERQATQARYVAEYGMYLTVAQLSNGSASAVLKQARDPSFAASQNCKAQTGMLQPTCYKVFYKDMNDILNTGSTNICEATVPGTAGSLGMANTAYYPQCDFSVELTDWSRGITPPGYNLDPAVGSVPKFYYVTATSTGRVFLTTTAAATQDALSGQSSAVKTIRSRILAGPFM